MTRLLTLREVMQMTALSRSAIYALMGAARFPKPIRLGRRAVRWIRAARRIAAHGSRPCASGRIAWSHRRSGMTYACSPFR